MKIKFRCCFCGEASDRGDADLCSLALTTPTDESQTQWCHLECFARAAPYCDIYVTRASP
jgi:hypothetical protein